MLSPLTLAKNPSPVPHPLMQDDLYEKYVPAGCVLVDGIKDLLLVFFFYVPFLATLRLFSGT